MNMRLLRRIYARLLVYEFVSMCEDSASSL